MFRHEQRLPYGAKPESAGVMAATPKYGEAAATGQVPQ